MSSTNKKTKSHRRHASEPGLWSASLFSQKSLDTLDIVDEVDFSLSPGTSQEFSFLNTQQDEYGEANLSGLKHNRSRDDDDTITRTSYHNNSTFSSSTKAANGGGPIYHSHRRVRSMPSSDLDMLDIFQSLGPAIVDNTAILPPQPQHQLTHQESTDILEMIPALGSMSMDVYDILKANSEDWPETLTELNQEQVPTTTTRNRPFLTTKTHSQSSLKSLPSLSPCSSGEFQSPLRSFSQLPTQVVKQRFSSEFFTGEDLSDGFQTPGAPSASQHSPPPSHPPQFPNDQSSSASNSQMFGDSQMKHKSSFSMSEGGDAEVKGHRRNHTTGMISVDEIFPDRSPFYQFPPQQRPPQAFLNTPFSHHNLTSATQRPSISEPEYHLPKSRLKSSTTEDLESYGSKNSRGKYRCGLCGQLKANHHCPYMIEVPTRSISTQADPPVADPNIPTSHPFYSARTVTVGGGRKPTPYSAAAAYLYSRHPAPLPPPPLPPHHF